MPIRVVHTADNHVGISFQRYQDTPAVRERLLAERIEALRRIVREANGRQAHFLVVAGDLFDRPNVARKDIASAVEVLAGFSGEAVLVLPGNHDFHEGPGSSLWKTFCDEVGSRPIVLLTRAEVASFEIYGQAVRFYPCPCPSKLGEQSLIDWVRAAPKEPGAIHVGIAHGNVEGLGMDEQGRYFNMRQEDLRAAGVATWLLGHIHLPFPEQGSGGSPAFFMPGIPTPDSVKCRHRGHAWYLEIAADGVTGFEQLVTGGLRFVRLERTLRGRADIEQLERATAELAAGTPPVAPAEPTARAAPEAGVSAGGLSARDIVLDLQLDGRLRTADRAALEALLERLREQFLFVSCVPAIAHELDAAELEGLYPAGSLPHRVLAKLIGDPDHPDAAWLAHELFQELRP